MKPVELDLPSGERAVIAHSDGERASIHCIRAFPPGSTLEGAATDGSGTFRIKVRACRRRTLDDATDYEIEGRLVSLTRSQRSRLLKDCGEL